MTTQKINAITANFTLQQWLSYIEALHPKAIEMGLDRVQVVADKLQLKPSFPIITVAGTNGKGSACAMLAAVYKQAGYCVGNYASPHLIRYNERITVNNQEITDADLCLAFAAVELARGEVALTYFEIGTLATMWHFCRTNLEVGQLDVAILEVGLGGRLDAVNIFEPSCTIVTTVDLDHMEYLGDTREKIGFEKAGIYRANILAICGDGNAPLSLIRHAEKIGAKLSLINDDFYAEKNETGWLYCANGVQLQMPKLGLIGDFQHSNAACVVRAVHDLNAILPVSQANIYAALGAVKLTGRFQKILINPSIIADVAHNPHAAISLAHNLQANYCAGRTLAVFAMLRDKDIEGVINTLAIHFDAWYVADNHSLRGAKAEYLLNSIIKNMPDAIIASYDSVALALDAACKDAGKNDRIIVFGSFYTVADAINAVKDILPTETKA